MKLAIIAFAVAALPFASYASDLNPTEATAYIYCKNGIPTVDMDQPSTTEVVFFEYNGAYPTSGEPIYSIQIGPGICSNYPDGTTLTGGDVGTDYCEVEKTFSYTFTVNNCHGMGEGTVRFYHSERHPVVLDV